MTGKVLAEVMQGVFDIAGLFSHAPLPGDPLIHTGEGGNSWIGGSQHEMSLKSRSGDCQLLLAQPFEPVTNGGRLFELQLSGCLLHGRLQRLHLSLQFFPSFRHIE